MLTLRMNPPLLHELGLAQVAAVPSRATAVQAADQAIESVLQKVMEQSFSVEERTRVRRMAALRKVILLRVPSEFPVRRFHEFREMGLSEGDVQRDPIPAVLSRPTRTPVT